MVYVLDSNVLIAFLNNYDALNRRAEKALTTLSSSGRLIVCGAVFAELVASPALTEKYLEGFLHDAGIAVDWKFDENVWRAAGKAFRGYAERRRKARSAHPRRLLADFLIGAHASVNNYPLLTLDDRLYRVSFPKLRLISA